MNQRSLNRQVARITGETKRAIARLGFSLVKVDEPASDGVQDDHKPQWVDWDEVQRARQQFNAS